jgi:hypothetical protein
LWQITQEAYASHVAAEHARQEREQDVGRRCVHCQKPLVVEAMSPRWRGYCDQCARTLCNHPRLDSA